MITTLLSLLFFENPDPPPRPGRCQSLLNSGEREIVSRAANARSILLRPGKSRSSWPGGQTREGDVDTELAIFFQKVLYIVTFDDSGAPTIHASGRPAEIPEGAYAEAILHPQINFACERCGQPVKSAFPNFHAQICRCLLVKHHSIDRGFTSAEEWTAFRETYERESQNPAPDNPVKFDPISKQPIGAQTRP